MNLRAASARPRRYLLTGLACALLHNGIVITADRLGIHYMAALVLSALIVTPVGYSLHTVFTFGARFSWRQFLRFAGGIAIGFPLSFAIMFVLCSILSVPPSIATPIATLLLFVWNYVAAHWAIALGRKQERASEVGDAQFHDARSGNSYPR